MPPRSFCTFCTACSDIHPYFHFPLWTVCVLGQLTAQVLRSTLFWSCFFFAVRGAVCSVWYPATCSWRVLALAPALGVCWLPPARRLLQVCVGSAACLWCVLGHVAGCGCCIAGCTMLV